MAFSDSSYDSDMAVSSDSEYDYDYDPHDDVVVNEGDEDFLPFRTMLMIHALYDVVKLGENQGLSLSKFCLFLTYLWYLLLLEVQGQWRLKVNMLLQVTCGGGRPLGEDQEE